MNGLRLSVIILPLILCLNVCAFPEKEKAVYYDSQKRDPFIPLVDEKGDLRKNFKKPEAENLFMKSSLTATCMIKGALYAIIDGELVKEGDIFKGYKIEKVEPDKVILGLGDKKFELRLEAEKKQ